MSRIDFPWSYGSQSDGMTNREFDIVAKVQKPFVDNDLLCTLFAPNPVTGHPDNGLKLMFNPNLAPEVQTFLRQTVLKVHPSVSGAPDDDTALALVKPRDAQLGNEIAAYYEKVQSFAESLQSEEVNLTDNSTDNSPVNNE